jgi:hypothetical protein
MMFNVLLAIIIGTLYQKVTLGAKISSSKKYLRSVTEINQGLFTYQAGESLSSSVASTSSSLIQTTTASQESTVASSVTISGVLALKSVTAQSSTFESFADIEISLQDQDGRSIKNTFSNSDGVWQIANVVSGYYKLKIDIPSGFLLMGYDSNEISITVDSSKNSVVVKSYVLDSSSHASIGSVKGIIQGLESYSDVTVMISNPSGSIVAAAKPEYSGSFEFSNLLEGNYFIHIDIPSLDITKKIEVTIQHNQVSDVSINPLDTYSQTETDVGTKSNICGSINGFAWVDFNENGVKNFDLSGLENVEISLYYVNGTAFTTTITDSLGFYSFSCVFSGIYNIKFENPRPDVLNFSGDETEPDNQTNNAGVAGGVIVNPGQNTNVSGGLIVKPGVKCGALTSNDIAQLPPKKAYEVILYCNKN